jgi:CheY-like chemotaxis protein
VSVIAVTDDLFFGARILETARALAVPLTLLGWRDGTPARIREAAPALLLLDLSGETGPALELIRALKEEPPGRVTTLLGFLPHVRQDARAAAEAAGCDRVLTRATFTEKLPEILRPYAAS